MFFLYQQTKKQNKLCGQIYTNKKQAAKSPFKWSGGFREGFLQCFSNRVLCYIFSLQWQLYCISVQPFPTRFHVKNISYIDGHLVHLIDTENNFWYPTTPGRFRNQVFKWHYLLSMLKFGSAAKSQILMMPQKTHSCIYFFVSPSCCGEKDINI